MRIYQVFLKDKEEVIYSSYCLSLERGKEIILKDAKERRLQINSKYIEKSISYFPIVNCNGVTSLTKYYIIDEIEVIE